MNLRHRDRATEFWRTQAGEPAALRQPGVVLTLSDEQRLAPTGWVGVVSIGDSVVVAGPRSLGQRLEAGLPQIASADALTIRSAVAEILGEPVATLGPAILAYGVVLGVAPNVIGPLPVDDHRVQRLLDQCSPADRDESTLDETTSGVFLAADDTGEPVSGCGYSLVGNAIAHTAVLTVPSQRGQGHGKRAATGALNLAATSGHLTQWRAAESNLASIALGRSLGLERLGRQFSFRLA